MKKILISIVLLFHLPGLFSDTCSQTPTVQDCPGSIPICNTTYTYSSSFVGEGNYPGEVSTSSCLSTSENNTVWFTFTAQATGDLGFIIDPPTTSTDYDWAVYNITGIGCSGSTISQGAMVSCNYSADDGQTGPNGGSSYSSQDATGNAFNAFIPTTAGNNYVIVIDNYTGNDVGFTVDFGVSPTSIIDNTPPSFLSVTTPPCGATTLNFDFSESILCSSISTGDFTLTGPGGPYTITSVSSVNCGNGGSQDLNFALTVSPPITASGSYSLNLVGSVTDLCSNTAPASSKPFTVTNSADANWTPPGTLCTSSSSVNLSSLITGTTGGTWSGTGVSGTTFNPSTAGAGVHNVTYSVTVGGCTDTRIQSITVNAVPDATITTAGPFCTSDAATNLTAATGGGTWSGTGITNASSGTFDPVSAGAGTHTITYSLTSGGCTGTDTETITVNATTNATITASGPFCTSDAATNLTAATGGGTWSGTGITNTSLGTFNPAAAGAGSHTITYTISGSCGSTDTETITVNLTPDATITTAGPFCTGDASTNLTAATGGGTWSGTGITNASSGTFDPASAGAGTHSITYSVTSGGCTGTDSESITVNATPNAAITAAGPFCTSDAATNLSAATGGGTWSGTGITNAGLGTFNPATAGAGTHTITYSVTSGGCPGSDTETITVSATPDATITAVGALCPGDSPVTLTAATGGGTFSGTGVSGNTFDPAAAGVGTHTITYSVTLSGCTGTDTETITVNSSSDATITAVSALCTNDAPVTLTAATGGGTWSGTGVSGNTFDPGTAGSGTHTVTYTISGSCGSSDTETITVNATPDATITAAGPFCTSDVATNLTAATGGGTWSGTGITNPGSGTFDPSVAGAGTHSISYSISSGGCTGTDNETITVNTTPDAAITAAGPFCSTDAPANLTAATGGGTWSGTGITNAGSGTFDPATAGAGTHSITYSVSASGCTGTDTESITVNATPDATITAPGALCPGDSPITLTAATSGGSFSGTGVSGNTFDPAIAGAGTHTITYTVTVNGCTSSDTETITVSNSTDATVNPITPLCTGDSPVLLTAATGGGTWSGTGVSGNSFDPSMAGAGTHTITYTISGACGSADTETATVTANPDATIAPVSSMCTGDLPVTLSAATGGGTFSGTGVSGNIFDPAISGAGTFTITYNVSSGGCSSSDTEMITVNSNSDASITPTGPFCTGEAPVTLSAATGGGVWTGNGVTGNTFDPAAAGVGTHTILYTISGSCGDSDSILITVDPSNDATINSAGPFCSSDAPENLNAVTGGGTWSGTGITNPASGTFNPSAAGAGTHLITYTISGSCGSSDTIFIIVNPQPDATINPVGSLCSNDSAMTLTAAQSGGTWSGTGVSGNSFDPSVSGSGIFVITYTISGVCTDIDIDSVTVTLSADAAINAAGPFCENDPPINLSAVQSGGTWSGTGITNPSSGTFNPSAAGTGTHLITYTISGTCGDIDTASVIVSPNADATIAAPDSVCASDTAITLSAAQGGGTWSGTGVTGNIFDPAAAGAGIHTVTYTIGGACGGIDTKDILVNPAADASINPVSPLCVNSAAINITAAQSGGIWSGNGITNTGTGTFNPAVAGAGSHLITYTINGSCGNMDTLLVIVNPPSDATITSTGPYCDDILQVNLTANDSSGFWTGPGVTGSQFFPSLLTPGNYTVIYTIPGSCGDIDSVSIEVVGTPDAAINDPGPLCDTTAVFNLTAANPGGTWSGTGITNPSSGAFDPSVSGGGAFTVVHINTNQMCSDTDSVTITVGNVPPAPTATSEIICYTELPFTLTALGTGGQLTWYYTDTAGTIFTENDSDFVPAVMDGIPDSTYYYCVMEQNGNCPSACTPVTLTVVTIDASFASPSDSGEIPYTIVFDNTSFGIDSNDIFAWSFGDGDSSVLYNPTHVYDEIGDYTITLTVYDSAKVCSDTYTLTIHAKGSSTVLVPNIFTPNGDNVNDVFNLIYKNLISVEGIIYNRWGELIYEWSSVEAGWDGRTMAGTLAPDGVYYYLIKASGTDEPEPRQYEFHGFVTLVR